MEWDSDTEAIDGAALSEYSAPRKSNVTYVSKLESLILNVLENQMILKVFC